MRDEHMVRTTSYQGYWTAWLVLLVLTALMVLANNKSVLIAGILAKSTIICAWFMHLRQERAILIASVVAGFLIAGFLFFLLRFDVSVGVNAG